MHQYRTARSLFSFGEFMAWTVVGAGGLAVMIGYAIGSRSLDFGYGTSFFAGLAGAAPGLLLIAIGIGYAALMQIGRANVDTAQMTGEILNLTREQIQIARNETSAPRKNPSIGAINKSPDTQRQARPVQPATQERPSAGDATSRIEPMLDVPAITEPSRQSNIGARASGATSATRQAEAASEQSRLTPAAAIPVHTMHQPQPAPKAASIDAEIETAMRDAFGQQEASSASRSKG